MRLKGCTQTYGHGFDWVWQTVTSLAMADVESESDGQSARLTLTMACCTGGKTSPFSFLTTPTPRTTRIKMSRPLAWFAHLSILLVRLLSALGRVLVICLHAAIFLLLQYFASRLRFISIMAREVVGKWIGAGKRRRTARLFCILLLIPALIAVASIKRMARLALCLIRCLVGKQARRRRGREASGLYFDETKDHPAAMQLNDSYVLPLRCSYPMRHLTPPHPQSASSPSPTVIGRSTSDDDDEVENGAHAPEEVRALERLARGHTAGTSSSSATANGSASTSWRVNSSPSPLTPPLLRLYIPHLLRHYHNVRDDLCLGNRALVWMPGAQSRPWRGLKEGDIIRMFISGTRAEDIVWPIDTWVPLPEKLVSPASRIQLHPCGFDPHCAPPEPIVAALTTVSMTSPTLESHTNSTEPASSSSSNPNLVREHIIERIPTNDASLASDDNIDMSVTGCESDPKFARHLSRAKRWRFKDLLPSFNDIAGGKRKPLERDYFAVIQLEELSLLCSKEYCFSGQFLCSTLPLALALHIQMATGNSKRFIRTTVTGSGSSSSISRTPSNTSTTPLVSVMHPVIVSESGLVHVLVCRVLLLEDGASIIDTYANDTHIQDQHSLGALTSHSTCYHSSSSASSSSSMPCPCSFSFDLSTPHIIRATSAYGVLPLWLISVDADLVQNNMHMQQTAPIPSANTNPARTRPNRHDDVLPSSFSSHSHMPSSTDPTSLTIAHLRRVQVRSMASKLGMKLQRISTLGVEG